MTSPLPRPHVAPGRPTHLAPRPLSTQDRGEDGRRHKGRGDLARKAFPDARFADSVAGFLREQGFAGDAAVPGWSFECYDAAPDGNTTLPAARDNVAVVVECRDHPVGDAWAVVPLRTLVRLLARERRITTIEAAP